MFENLTDKLSGRFCPDHLARGAESEKGSDEAMREIRVALLDRCRFAGG